MIRVSTVTLAGLVLAGASPCAWPQPQLQEKQSVPREARPLQQQKVLGLAPPVKIEIVDFSFRILHVPPGSRQWVSMTITNTGTGAVAAVPWTIHDYTDNRTLASGEQANVAPGASFTVTANWVATPGTRKLQGYVDPTGKVLKNSAPVASRMKNRDFSAPQITGYDAGPQRCMRPGAAFVVRGVGFGERLGRSVNWGGHQRGGELEVVTWSDTSISVTMPATAAPESQRFYFVGLMANQRWVSNIDRNLPAC